MRVIDLEKVTLRYRIPRERILSLKEYTIRKIQRRVAYDDLEAVKDVDLKVEAGERIGVIGRNGAGKSTLFRVISRVLPPSEGRVRVAGRVAPILSRKLNEATEPPPPPPPPPPPVDSARAAAPSPPRSRRLRRRLRVQAAHLAHQPGGHRVGLARAQRAVGQQQIDPQPRVGRRGRVGAVVHAHRDVASSAARPPASSAVKRSR